MVFAPFIRIARRVASRSVVRFLVLMGERGRAAEAALLLGVLAKRLVTSSA